jgi:hypothetical protein
MRTYPEVPTVSLQREGTDDVRCAGSCGRYSNLPVMVEECCKPIHVVFAVQLPNEFLQYFNLQVVMRKSRRTRKSNVE